MFRRVRVAQTARCHTERSRSVNSGEQTCERAAAAEVATSVDISTPLNMTEASGNEAEAKPRMTEAEYQIGRSQRVQQRPSLVPQDSIKCNCGKIRTHKNNFAFTKYFLT